MTARGEREWDEFLKARTGIKPVPSRSQSENHTIRTPSCDTRPSLCIGRRWGTLGTSLWRHTMTSLPVWRDSNYDVTSGLWRHFRFGEEGPKPDSFPEIPVDHTAHAQQLSGNSRHVCEHFRKFPTAFRKFPYGGLGRGLIWPRGSASYVDEGPWVRVYDVIPWRHFRFGWTEIMTSLRVCDVTSVWPSGVSGNGAS